MTQKKKVGRPKKLPMEKCEIIPIRLNDHYRQGISQLGKAGLAANVRFLFDEYQIWVKARTEIHKKLEERSRLFIQAFALFVEANHNKKFEEANTAKEKVLRTAVDLKFLSDLLGDAHHYLSQLQGQLHFRHLQDVWKIAKIDH